MQKFRTWRNDLEKRIRAEQEIEIDLLIGAALIDGAAQRASDAQADRLRLRATSLRQEQDELTRRSLALDEELATLAMRWPDRSLATRYERELAVWVDRERARFGAWYELFPRSCASEPGRHGTLADCEAKLDYVAAMGFQVLYLPPVHPIGRTYRKGKNNAASAVSEILEVHGPLATGKAVTSLCTRTWEPWKISKD